MAGLTLQALKDAWSSGAKVEAQSTAYVDGVWYEVKVLQFDAQRVKVHYVGFSDDEDEWLPLTHFRLQDLSRSATNAELSSEVIVLRKQVESMSERFQLSAEQAQMKQTVSDLQKQVEALKVQVDGITSTLEEEPPDGAGRIPAPRHGGPPDPTDPAGPGRSEAFPRTPVQLEEQVMALTEQVELSKHQTEQAASMVERLAESMEKQALDASNLEQAFVRSESKMIGLQASSVSVLEGRLRVFVKTELDHAVLGAMEDCNVMHRLEVVESAQRQMVEAVEEETRWLRDAVEALSESVGIELVPNAPRTATATAKVALH